MRNAVFLGLSNNKAIFTVTDNSVDALNIDKYPFSCISQPQLANGLLTMSIENLHRAAEMAAKNAKSDKLGFIFTTGRSGSTLLSQILTKVPSITIISQPWVFNYLVVHQFSEQERRKILTSSVSAIK